MLYDFMYLMDEHPLKDPVPRDVTCLPSDTHSALSQSLNARAPTELMAPSGMIISVSKEHPWKDSTPNP